MKILMTTFVAVALAAAPAAASASEIRFRTGTSQEMSGAATFNSSILLTVACAHTLRLTSRNLRHGTGTNTSLLISRLENHYSIFSGCSYTTPILFCSGTAQVSVETDWTLTAQSAVGGLASVTIDTGRPALRITLTGVGCLTGCVITIGTSRLSGAWGNASPARLSIVRQRMSYTTNYNIMNRFCVSVASGSLELTESLTETTVTVTGTISIS